MEYRKFGDAYFVRMDRGEEILEQLTALCEAENIRLASVEAIGAVDYAKLALLDVPAKEFHRREFSEPMEMSSLTGSVTRMDGKVNLHLHATVCDAQQRAWGGHVNALRVSATCEMIVRTYPGEVGRVYSESIGLNLFSF